MVLFLSRSDVESLVTMREAVQAVEKAFLELHEGKAVCPKRLIISVDKHEGFVYYMPAYLSQTESLAIKIVTQYEENLKHGLPTILASILLNDPENGKPLALMDGTYITATRTGAASAVATKYLARKDSSVAGVIGTGGQARAQVQGLREVLENLARIKVYDILPKRAEEFADIISRELSLTAEAVGTSKQCVENSDVIVLATTSKVPVLDGDWIKVGAHINSIGVVGPEGRELDDKTVKKAKIVVDTAEGALAETGDLIIPIKKGIISQNDIYAELHEIVGGKKLGRTSNDEITCWKAVGIALEDAAVAKLVYDKAKKEGIGKEVDI
jgi:ornithine cyclodeaminase/alanine dehydrogenase